eukprot:1390783-Amphidinium_carterae.1
MCRCVISTEKNRNVVFETEDHKPNTPAEKELQHDKDAWGKGMFALVWVSQVEERIERMGGEVRTQTYSDGWVNHRIFVKGKDS